MFQSVHSSQNVKVVSHLSELPGALPCGTGGRVPVVLALGVFDGVHVGHQAVISELCRLGREHQALPVALFFEPHPRAVLGKGPCPKRLSSVEDKIRLLGELGIAAVVCCPFSVELAGLSPQEFLSSYLEVSGVEIRGFCVGDDWRFGHLNAGDGQLLERLSGVSVSIVPPVMDQGQPVSSTRIREALESGDVAGASRMLGRRFRLHGAVSHGQGKGGSVLSTPTANVLGESVQLPKFGVYAAYGIVAGQRHEGIVYVGDAPTLRGKDVIVELHLFDFSGDLYGQDLTVEFVSYLRGSILFEDASALQRQIMQDIETTRRILSDCERSLT